MKTDILNVPLPPEFWRDAVTEIYADRDLTDVQIETILLILSDPDLRALLPDLDAMASGAANGVAAAARILVARFQKA